MAVAEPSGQGPLPWENGQQVCDTSKAMASPVLLRRWQALDDWALSFRVMRVEQQMKSASPTRLGSRQGSGASSRSQFTHLLCRNA